MIHIEKHPFIPKCWNIYLDGQLVCQTCGTKRDAIKQAEAAKKRLS